MGCCCCCCCCKIVVVANSNYQVHHLQHSSFAVVVVDLNHSLGFVVFVQPLLVVSSSLPFFVVVPLKADFDHLASEQIVD